MNDVNAIVQRIRETGSRKHQDGYAAGQQFAHDEADIDDFEFFANLSEDNTDDWTFATVNCLAEYDVLGEETRPRRWVRGFVEGVQDVWKQVAPQVSHL